VAHAKCLSDGSVTLSDLQEDHITVEARYTKYFDRVVLRNMPPRSERTLGVVLCGPPATGKSHMARLLCKCLGVEGYYLRMPADRQETWFENYINTPYAVVIEEFDYTRIKLADVNTWLDEFPCLVNVKGSQAQFIAKIVIFCSNTDIDDMYPHSEAFRSRLNLIIRFSYGAVAADFNARSRKDVASSSVIDVVKDDGAVVRELPDDDD